MKTAATLDEKVLEHEKRASAPLVEAQKTIAAMETELLARRQVIEAANNTIVAKVVF